MNPHETEDLVKTILHIRDTFDMTILLIEHDMKFVSGLCDEVTVLNFGTVLAAGDTKTALSDPEVIRAYIGG
jgi:branched-chain amino acid transport system ATP-binding protein